MDSSGGVWSARWQSGKVVRFSPDGVIDVIIDFPTAWHMTCVIFGGGFWIASVHTDNQEKTFKIYT
jgi:sugar lactone lactonase YvrE